ncbi:MAG: aminotransferase class I/II-fold pyridoxal phosphate-dependent enzyme [Verrucomicrobia bacterium]|nr:aminotransferase class I/II-fold pyridoxal phosphate-dependent enzyme [Verrucomicrobiota bacterium]
MPPPLASRRRAMPTPFEVRWTEAQVETVLAQVRAYPWPVAPEVEDGWAYGCDGAWLKSLCAYWVDGFDWKAAVANLNRFPQFTAKVGDFDLHYLHVVGEAGGKRPLLITHGSQQLLYLLTEALCDPGDIVLVEDPTYFVYLGIAQSHGLRCRGVRLLPDGLDLAHLEQVLEELRRRGDLPRVKLLYLVTYYQNPTGYTTSFAKKAAALKLLRRYEKFAGHPLYLIEDAAYRELRFAGEEVPSALAAPGGADRVLYAGTFSKPFATGVRVGFGVLPEPIRTTATRIKGNHDFGTANLLQQLLARALATGAYERHLAELQRRYAHKARVMTDAIRAHFPANVEWREPAGGLYVWARAPKRLRTGAKSRFFQTALKRNVLYVPGALCYANDPTRRQPDHEMRLSYGGASERDLAEGIKRLGTVLSA